MDIYKGFLGLCGALLLLLVWMVFQVGATQQKTAAKYAEACTATGGTTVYNGRHYECLKGMSK